MKRVSSVAVFLAVVNLGCGAFRSIFALNAKQEPSKPIRNPFGEFSSANEPNETIIFRTKKGDNAVEVELPKATQEHTDFVFPVSPMMGKGANGFNNRSPAAETATSGDALMDERYKDQTPGLSDREITKGFPQGMAEDGAKRQDIEHELGLVPPEDSAPIRNKSYLAATDHVKQLYKYGRYEAALIEIDELLREYPTDPRLHQMRGTLLERLGQHELALKSWNQALRFNPGNESLKRFIERKTQKRSLASP